MKADALLLARKYEKQIRFSSKLEWIDVDGELQLRKARIDGKQITLYTDAIEANDADPLEMLQSALTVGDFTFRHTPGGHEHDQESHGNWSDGPGGVDFVSPNVADHLDLPEAISALKGKQQAALKEASAYIDEKIGLKVTTKDVVGAWSDGAENSIANFHSGTKWTDWSKIVTAASMKGHLADQKSVLVFQEKPDRKPRESVVLKGSYPNMVGKIDVTVEVNPTRSEVRSLVQEFKMVRVLVDEDGNLYAWEADKAIHDQVAGALDLPGGAHKDVWFPYEGRIISDRYLTGNTVEERAKTGAKEVREKLASLEGDAVLLSFEAKGSLESIHQNLLSDGLAFHTLVPHEGGATVYAAAVNKEDVKDTVAVTKQAAGRYGSKITYRAGRGEFIGDTLGTGSDREQRDRARSVYEGNIRRSDVSGSQAIWEGVRHRWGEIASPEKIAASFFRHSPGGHEHDQESHGNWSDGPSADANVFQAPHGETWQQVAQAAVDTWKAGRPKVKASTVALKDDIDQMMSEAEKFEDYRDWYARHVPLAKKLFGENEPYFEKFLAATSINSSGKPNVDMALRATIHFINGGTFEAKNYTGVMGAIRDELLKVQHGEPLTGLKVVPFSQVLLGDWDHAPADRHMKNLLFKNPSEAPNAAQAEVTEVVIQAIAKKMGWKTAELQAVTWCVDKAREKNGNSGNIFDYLQYMKDQEAKVRTLLDEHKRLRSASAYKKSFNEDEVGDALKQEAKAWSNAQLLLNFFQALHNKIGENLTPDKIAATLGISA